MPRKAYFVFVCFLLTQIATAHADSLQDSLNQKYKDHVMALRSPFTHGNQKFDFEWQVIESAARRAVANVWRNLCEDPQAFIQHFAS